MNSIVSPSTNLKALAAVLVILSGVVCAPTTLCVLVGLAVPGYVVLAGLAIAALALAVMLPVRLKRFSALALLAAASGLLFLASSAVQIADARVVAPLPEEAQMRLERTVEVEDVIRAFQFGGMGLVFFGPILLWVEHRSGLTAIKPSMQQMYTVGYLAMAVMGAVMVLVSVRLFLDGFGLI